MFEDSLMESQNRLTSPNQRWTTILSVTLQSAVVAAVIALPLLHPEALPFHIEAPNITLPPRHLPPPVPRVKPSSAAPTPIISGSFAKALSSPTHISPLSHTASDMPPATDLTGSGMGGLDAATSILSSAGAGTGPHVMIVPARPAPKGILHISTGVLAGLLLAPIKPVYPRIAAAARIEGTVKVEAIISRSGRIESAHVVSGPNLLRQAALDAIRNAQYTPYLLNGAPTEVDTTITVNFKLST